MKSQSMSICFIFFITICLFTPMNLVFSDESVSRDSSFDQQVSQSIQYQIVPSIKNFTMMFPPGESIGTFKEYQTVYPYLSASFQQVITPLKTTVAQTKNISILVNAWIYPLIDQSLDLYVADLRQEGYQVTVETLQGGSPESVKQWLLDEYENRTEGFVFIGDIPAAWMKVSESVFPCDLFYMDLDGQWEDINSDGVYDVHTTGDGDMGPEIYIGRLFASSLNWSSEASMIQQYLQKVHLYRSGVLTAPWQGLEYVDEDWYDMNTFLSSVYYQNVTRYDFGFSTTASDYINNLQRGYHYVQVCAHSYPGGHHFSTKPTEAVVYAHVYVYSPHARDVKLLLGVDDGIKVWINQKCVFEKDKYNGWYQKDQYRIDAQLVEGWNQLLLKISQEAWEYGFSARFTDEFYQSIPDLTYQCNHPDESLNEPEYIRSWLINGFHQDASENFYNYLNTNYLDVPESTMHPVEGDEDGGNQWVRFDASGPIVNLNQLYKDMDYGCTYAYVKIIANETQACQLCLGYDDGMRAWFNGHEIIYDNRYGSLDVDMMTVNVTVLSGENHLLLKISEWMGDHWFSACLRTMDGENLSDVFFVPEMQPVSYIGTWLVNGVYENNDVETRLSTDYLNEEAKIEPQPDMIIQNNTWVRALGDGAPFDLNAFFDTGDWVFSETIQTIDPPVLFYNLFACGPGRFTDKNYLAGSYIFNTTYGLSTVASAKSGSMLFFEDFYTPLGQGKTLGESFQSWFEAQAPFEQWEKEWYYGMVLCGDPTLVLQQNKEDLFDIFIKQPTQAVYVNDTLLFPFFIPVVFGDITLVVDGISSHAIDHVSLLVDNEEKINATDVPLYYQYTDWSFGKKTIKIVASDTMGHKDTETVSIWKFF